MHDLELSILTVQESGDWDDQVRRVVLAHGEALVDEAIDQDLHRPPRVQMLSYPAALPLSRQTLTYTAGIIRRHRSQIESPWRKLNAGQQAGAGIPAQG